MLRLLPQPGEGQDPPAVRRRKGAKPAALTLTAEEVRHTRAALTNAARAYGGMDVLATVLGIPVASLYRISKRRRPSGTLAIRIASAAGVSVEAMLSGALNAAGRCSTCGHRAGDGRLAVVAGGAA